MQLEKCFGQLNSGEVQQLPGARSGTNSVLSALSGSPVNHCPSWDLTAHRHSAFGWRETDWPDKSAYGISPDRVRRRAEKRHGTGEKVGVGEATPRRSSDAYGLKQ